jgi:hypothetical protein
MANQSVLPGKATPIAVFPAGTPLGLQNIPVLTAAVALTPPPGATYALITPTGQAVRWRDDGVAPTAALGMPIGVGQIVTLANLAALRFIEQTPSAALNVSYYR